MLYILPKKLLHWNCCSSIFLKFLTSTILCHRFVPRNVHVTCLKQARTWKCDGQADRLVDVMTEDGAVIPYFFSLITYRCFFCCHYINIITWHSWYYWMVQAINKAWVAKDELQTIMLSTVNYRQSEKKIPLTRAKFEFMIHLGNGW